MNQQTPLNTDCKIFIVDDDEQQAHLMQEMAKTAEIETTVFTSSLDFLSASVTRNDVVVLDLQMPEKDGIEIMRDLALENIKPHFILVSGFDERVLHSAKQLAVSKQLDVIATLSKPIKAKGFIALLKDTLKQCRLNIEAQNKLLTADETDIPSSLYNNPISIDELKLAIRRHELIVHFQPLVCMKTNQIVSAEILVRWLHATNGLLLPEQFIPLAEEHNLMNLLTEEILGIAIKEYHKLTACGHKIKVSINLSAQNILDLSMPEKLEALLKSNQIDPASFILEVTESVLMNEISDSLDILNRLRMKGFSLSIDDFGTGYSSLVKLYQAPFSELKIDRQFILNMPDDHDAIAIVKICILLAKELNMKTVAEGVETKETWDQLVNLGCDKAQGFFITKPLAVEDFCSWMNENVVQ